MSTYIHTAIIVTGSNFDGRIDDAAAHARSLGFNPTEAVRGRNFFDSFMVAPSGSGDLHPSAAAHAEGIAALVDYLRGRVGEGTTPPSRSTSRWRRSALSPARNSDISVLRFRR